MRRLQRNVLDEPQYCQSMLSRVVGGQVSSPHVRWHPFTVESNITCNYGKQIEVEDQKGGNMRRSTDPNAPVQMARGGDRKRRCIKKDETLDLSRKLHRVRHADDASPVMEDESDI